MKNLEWQVSNLELSKRFCELGVKQDGCFIWYHFLPEDEWAIKHKSWGKLLATNLKLKKLEARKYYSAFTVAELGEISKKIKNITLACYYQKDTKIWICQDIEYKIKIPSSEAKTEANARAKMLIYLIENKLIKI